MDTAPVPSNEGAHHEVMAFTDQDRAILGLQRGHHPVAGPQVLGLAVAHRADDRALIGDARHPRHVLADLDAGHIRVDREERPPHVLGGVGFEVPHVHVGRPAREGIRDA